jgi:sugar/nucleoside kinase (ribokinase family)
VRRTVTIHTERGAVAATHEGEHGIQASLQLPAGFSRGATGAGDAFAAGLLYGLHEGWPLQKRLLLAVSVAASSLADPTPSAAVLSVHECLGLSERFGFGPFGQAA